IVCRSTTSQAFADCDFETIEVLAGKTSASTSYLTRPLSFDPLARPLVATAVVSPPLDGLESHIEIPPLSQRMPHPGGAHSPPPYLTRRIWVENIGALLQAPATHAKIVHDHDVFFREHAVEERTKLLKVLLDDSRYARPRRRRLGRTAPSRSSYHSPPR